MEEILVDIKCGENVTFRLTWSDEYGVTVYALGFGPMCNLPKGHRIFWNGVKDHITTVVMSDGITHLGDYTFKGCGNLTTLHLPNKLRSIGKWAFVGCGANLTALPSTVVRIEEAAFEGCEHLTLDHLPPKLEYIGREAFMYCPNLTLTFKPDTLLHIGSFAFEGCPHVSFS